VDKRELFTEGDEEYAVIAHLRGWTHFPHSCEICKLSRHSVCLDGHGQYRCNVSKDHAGNHASVAGGVVLETWPRKE
jgi:hypothetical protein